MSDLNNYLIDEMNINFKADYASAHGEDPVSRREITHILLQMNMISQQVWQLATGQEVPASVKLIGQGISTGVGISAQAAMLPTNLNQGGWLGALGAVGNFIQIGMAGYNFGKSLIDQLKAAGAVDFDSVDPGLKMFSKQDLKNGRMTFYE